MDNRFFITLSSSIGVQLCLPCSGKRSSPSTLPPPQKQRCARISKNEHDKLINKEQDVSERLFLAEKSVLKKSSINLVKISRKTRQCKISCYAYKFTAKNSAKLIAFCNYLSMMVDWLGFSLYFCLSFFKKLI